MSNCSQYVIEKVYVNLNISARIQRVFYQTVITQNAENVILNKFDTVTLFHIL